MRLRYILCILNSITIGVSAVALLLWRSSWPFVAAFAAFTLAVDVYFLANRRMFRLLEREDWPALCVWLEQRVFVQGRYTIRFTRLLANTYLTLADSVAVRELEQKTALASPSLIEENALVFGVARLLSKDITDATTFFSARLDAAVRVPSTARKRTLNTSSWLRWYYGFSLLLDRQYPRASEQFIILINEISPVPLITGLSAFLLVDTLSKALVERKAELLTVAESGRRQTRKRLPSIRHWNKAVSEARSEIHVVILLPRLQEAGAWLYTASGIR
ncbi:MAG: hypothetical protein LBF87_05410 [Treponema sp.]|nr:hypothetical protein [Treponema sp.]